MTDEIVIVSGLPRSGTSLMMQMLDMGGVEVVTDKIRTADTDNPRGYYEFEQVKKIKSDASWLPGTRGKAVKMVSQLLYDLPASETYRIIFMDRDMDEMLLSQEKMLQRLGRDGAPREKMRQAYEMHLQKLHEWLKKQSNMVMMRMSYNNVLQSPHEHAKVVAEFVGGSLNVQEMVKAIDTSLYRNRKNNISTASQSNGANSGGEDQYPVASQQQDAAFANQPFLDYVI
jgi:Sulfotransferase domain